MYIKIFYSWQSDTNRKFNKNFIEECIKRALKKMDSKSDVKVEWNLDRDTKGEIGTIDIVDTIFKKINECHVFIADITFIDSFDRNNEIKVKRTPNPNVLTELGYAAAKIGWENIITVFNSNYGRVEDLPFDIKLRRPLIYNFNGETTSEIKTRVRDEFIKVLSSTFDNCNPDRVNLKRKLVKEFNNESSEALRMVLETPDLWNIKLVMELVKKHLITIEFLEYEINNDLLYENIKKLDVNEFLSWSESVFGYVLKLLKVFNSTLTTEFSKIFEEEDEYVFAMRTKEVINRACQICIKSLELEKELSSIEVEVHLENLKNLLHGIYKIFVEAIRDLNENLSKAVLTIEETGNMDDVKIGIDIKDIFDKEKFYQEFQLIREKYLE